MTKFPVGSANCKVLKCINKAWRMQVCFVVVYTVLHRPSFVIAGMNTVTIFFNRQGSHLLIRHSRIKPFRVQTNRINIYMVTVLLPTSNFCTSDILANTPKSNEPAKYLSQRYIPNNVTLKTQKRVAFYDRCQPSARPR